MEYIEGATDLARLVKNNGPLPVARACDYIRQAALGLQHAYERGLVHRDIKPHNLLLTADGQTVKILDMGLARLDCPSPDGHKSSTMTLEGTLLGTPDYIAPEQAMESHTADIRADLYSLGCTLYYLLTGRVPFPKGTLIDKVTRHQLEQPPPVEASRADVPPEVVRILRKLMAKRPEDRYQTPAELVTALATASSTGSDASLAASGDERRDSERGPTNTSGTTLDSAFLYMGKGGNRQTAHAPQGRTRQGGKRNWLLFSVTAGAFFLLTVVVLLLLYFNEPAGKNPAADAQDPTAITRRAAKKAPTKVDDAWLKQAAFEAWCKHVAALPADKQGDAVADLSPLKGMQLTELHCYHNPIKDLSPLKGMPLTKLYIRYTRVTDLSPLKGMRLVELGCDCTALSDPSPLVGMPLTHLHVDHTQVVDLSPLEGMPLITLGCQGTKVTDLTPIMKLPLKVLRCDFVPERDADILRSIKTLEMINGKRAKEFWKVLDEKKQ